MIISLDAEKAFDKKPTTLLDKVLERLWKQWTDIPNYNKRNLLNAYSQHQIKWTDYQSNSAKVGNETRLSTLSLSV